MTVISDAFLAYRKRLEDVYSEFGPIDKATSKKTVYKSELMIYAAVCGFSVILVFLNGYDVFGIMSVIMASYVFFNEIPGVVTYFLRMRFYIELMAYLSTVRKKYMRLKNIPESIIAAGTGKSIQIRENASELNDILLTADRRENVRKYVGMGKRNVFLKLFLIQAYSASEYGDQISADGKSLFGENVELIREEIIREMYSIKKKYFVLSGYMFVAVMPVVCFSIVRTAGKTMTNTLDAFYLNDGKTILLFAFMCAFFVYLVISGAKNIKNQKYRYSNKRKYPRIIRKLAARSDTVGIRFLRKIIGEDSDTNQICALLSRILIFSVVTLFLCLVLGIYGNTYGIAAIAFMIFLSGIMPVLQIVFGNMTTQKEILDEIKSLENVLIMESRLNSMSLIDLLCDLELFSVVFRREIKECINGLASGNVAALKKLKMCGEKKHPEFSAVAEGFLMVDEVGICGAFSDMEINRRCAEKMQELEDMINLEKNRNLLDIISWIPAGIMIFGYFIIPFVVATLKEMEDVFELFTGV